MLTRAQRKFCEGFVSGLRGPEAYAAAYPGSSLKTAAAKASRLRHSSHINEEIARLRDEADLTAGSAVLTLMEARMFLARVVRASIARTPADSDLWRCIRHFQMGGGRYVLCDKLRAIRLDNNLSGHGDEADRDDAIGEMLERIIEANSFSASRPLPLALSVPHRKFCEGVVAGKDHNEAYSAAYPGFTVGYATSKACFLLRENNAIRAEIARLRAKAANLAGDGVLSLQEKRVFLARVVRARVADTPLDSDLWQSIRRGKCGFEYRLPDKLKAIRIACDLMPDEEKEAKGMEELMELLDRLGGKKSETKPVRSDLAVVALGRGV